MSAAAEPYVPPPEHVEDDFDEEYRQTKEYTVFLVDSGKAMFQPCGQRGEGCAPSDTWFDVAVRIVRETLSGKIIASPRTDEAAVVFYGPGVSKGPAPDDEEKTFTLNPVLEARRTRNDANAAAMNAVAGGGGGDGDVVNGASSAASAAAPPLPAPPAAGGGLFSSTTLGKPAAAKRAAQGGPTAAAASRATRESSGVASPSADLLRSLGELVGDTLGARTARSRLFVSASELAAATAAKRKEGDDDDDEEEDGGDDKQDPPIASFTALGIALRRAATLLLKATRGKKPCDYTLRVVVLSCQPLTFRSLWPEAQREKAEMMATMPSTMATTQMMVPSATSRASTDVSSQRSVLRERGTTLGGSGASLELIALEPIPPSSSSSPSSRKQRGQQEQHRNHLPRPVVSEMAGGVIPEDDPLSRYFSDANTERTAWGELLSASREAAQLRAKAAAERAANAMRLLEERLAEEAEKRARKEDKKRKWELEAARNGGGVDGEDLVDEAEDEAAAKAAAAQRLLELQQQQQLEELAAEAAADTADEAAPALAVTRFEGVSRVARGKVHRRRPLSTYFLLLPGSRGGGGGGKEKKKKDDEKNDDDGDEKMIDGDGEIEQEEIEEAGEEDTILACAVSLYQHVRRATIVAKAQVARRDYGALVSSSSLVPVAKPGPSRVGEGEGEGGQAAGALAVGGVGRIGFATTRAEVDKFRLSSVNAHAKNVAARAQDVVRSLIDEGLLSGDSRSEVLAELAKRSVLAPGVVELTADQLRRAKCVGVAAGGGGLDEEESTMTATAQGGGGRERSTSSSLPSPSFIEVLGFVPSSMVDARRSMRSPSFLYPNERHAPGSTAIFYALWDAMLGDYNEEEEEQEKNAGKDKDEESNSSSSQGVFAALATFSRKKGSPPQLVALLPRQGTEQEYEDGNGVVLQRFQVEPPGIDLVYLPSADDARPVAAPAASAGSSGTSSFGRAPFLAAKESAIEAAAELVDKLRIGGGSGEKDEEEREHEDCYFFSSEIRNPQLARHYHVLESLALGLDPLLTLTSASAGAMSSGGSRRRQGSDPTSLRMRDGTMPDLRRTVRVALPRVRALAAEIGEGEDDDWGFDEGPVAGGGRGLAGARRPRSAMEGGSAGGGGGGSTTAADDADDVAAAVLAGGNATVDQLKLFLRSRGLRLTGAKPALLARVREKALEERGG